MRLLMSRGPRGCHPRRESPSGREYVSKALASSAATPAAKVSPKEQTREMDGGHGQSKSRVFTLRPIHRSRIRRWSLAK
jgi:hypothetical protein